MARELVFRPKAQRDLARIILFVAHTADVPTASRYKQRMQRLCQTLILAPGKGMPYPRRPAIRKINIGPYKIFYRVTETEIVIMRIWDGRRENDPRLG